MASNLRVDNILPSSGTTLGIGTASGRVNFLGDTTITTSGTLSAASGTFTGNLNVAGVLTYEDVTNVDSVGLVTARDGIRIGTGGTVGPAASGIVTYYGDGSNLSGVTEFYGFTGIGSHLRLTYSNNGADNISATDYASFEDKMFGPSGITWSINNSGNLIATI